MSSLSHTPRITLHAETALRPIAPSLSPTIRQSVNLPICQSANLQSTICVKRDIQYVRSVPNYAESTPRPTNPYTPSPSSSSSFLPLLPPSCVKRDKSRHQSVPNYAEERHYARGMRSSITISRTHPTHLCVKRDTYAPLPVPNYAEEARGHLNLTDPSLLPLLPNLPSLQPSVLA